MSEQTLAEKAANLAMFFSNAAENRAATLSIGTSHGSTIRDTHADNLAELSMLVAYVVSKMEAEEKA